MKVWAICVRRCPAVVLLDLFLFVLFAALLLSNY